MNIIKSILTEKESVDDNRKQVLHKARIKFQNCYKYVKII